MKLIKPILFALFIAIVTLQNVFSQGVGIGQWREHLPYQKVISVAELGDLIYAATPYSLFYYNKKDVSITRLSKVNGLSDVNISVIATNPSQTTLIIAYSNTNIDLVQDGRVINISDIKRKQILGNKTINNITFIGENAYLACGFGIVVLDINRHEIIDTYFIGPSGTSINVNDIAYNPGNSKIYAATETGVISADFNSPNLAHFIYWFQDYTISTSEVSFNLIASYQNHIIVNKPGSGQNNDTLYIHDGTGWQYFDNSKTRRVSNISESNGKLLIAHNNQVYIYDESFTGIVWISDYKPGVMNSKDILISKEGTTFIADWGMGLMRQLDADYRFEAIRPNGPANHEVFAMQAVGSVVWVVPGARTSWWDNTWKSPVVYRFDGQSWNTYTYGLEPFRDLLSVAVDPYDVNHVFIGSWGYGLIEMRDGVIAETYNPTNSSLQYHTLRSDWSGVGGIAFDEDGNIWMSNNYAPNLISVKKTDGSWRSFSLNPVATAIELGTVIIDHSGQKWVLLRQHGLIVFNENGTIDNPADDRVKMLSGAVGNGNLPGSLIPSLAVDQIGELWIGTNEGVAIIRNPENVFGGGSFDAYRPVIDQDGYGAYLLETETVTSIAIDGANRKWFGTDKSGVFLMSADGMEQIYHFDEENSPLLSNSITSITIDDNGEVYFGTTSGIISFRSTATPPKPVFNEVTVFPNPVRPGYDGPIAIKGLVGKADIKITDIAGNLVWKQDAVNSAYRKEEGVFGGQTIWNGNNFDGKRAQSGVYLVFISNEDGSETMVAKILFLH